MNIGVTNFKSKPEHYPPPEHGSRYEGTTMEQELSHAQEERHDASEIDTLEVMEERLDKARKALQTARYGNAYPLGYGKELNSWSEKFAEYIDFQVFLVSASACGAFAFIDAITGFMFGLFPFCTPLAILSAMGCAGSWSVRNSINSGKPLTRFGRIVNRLLPKKIRHKNLLNIEKVSHYYDMKKINQLLAQKIDLELAESGVYQFYQELGIHYRMDVDECKLVEKTPPKVLTQKEPSLDPMTASELRAKNRQHKLELLQKITEENIIS